MAAVSDRAAAVLVVVISGCAPEVPANPTYTHDVKAILDAHCVRCHGAGDMLNSVPDVKRVAKAPARCYLQRYADEGDCSNLGNLDCKLGAGSTSCSSLAASYVTMPADFSMRMPPAPSDPLSDWEKEVMTRWRANGAPQ